MHEMKEIKSAQCCQCLRQLALNAELHCSGAARPECPTEPSGVHIRIISEYRNDTRLCDRRAVTIQYWIHPDPNLRPYQIRVLL